MIIIIIIMCSTTTKTKKKILQITMLDLPVDENNYI